MKIILENHKGEYIDNLSLENLEQFFAIFEKLNLQKKHHSIHIFAINEIINTYQLQEFKSNLKKIDFKSICIYSNIRETILTGKFLKIDSKFLNEKELRKKLFSTISVNQKNYFYKGTVRSGDRICSNGDLCIIGDVNPGAIVSAKRNIYVWGKLLGIASAGTGGDKTTSITSLYLKPLQLRIDDVVAIGPKEKPKYNYPEIAILEEEKIIIKPYIIET